MSKIKNVAVFTSIRSEFGLLTPLLHELKSDDFFSLKLIVAGSHLVQDYGYTVTEIEKAGFPIDFKIPFLDPADPLYETNGMSYLLKVAGAIFHENNFDLLVVLGDRFELLPLASAALVTNTPIAHISGGEVTEGSIDNQVRHALTKMSHVHFPATETYAENIRKMGEESWRICVSGEPGLDQILNLGFLSKETLFSDLGLDIDRPVICATFHPETIDNQISPDFVKNVLKSLLERTGMQVLVTAANFDRGGAEINEVLRSLAQQEHDLIFRESLGQLRYYSFLKYCSLMIGNSSSGLVEAQSFDLPVVNVGKRQDGRLANANVCNTGYDIEEIVNAIGFVQTQDFRQRFAGKQNIYGDGKASKRITEFLKGLPAGNKLLLKQCRF